MTDRFRTGTRVKWNWGQGVGRGKITESFERAVQRTIDGSKITRNGSTDNPAYLIETDKGDQVLKLKSEISRA